MEKCECEQEDSDSSVLRILEPVHVLAGYTGQDSNAEVQTGNDKGVDEGLCHRVMTDGHDLRHLNYQDLRNAFAVVSWSWCPGRCQVRMRKYVSPLRLMSTMHFTFILHLLAYLGY